MSEENKPIKSGGTGFLACAGSASLIVSRRNLPHWRFADSTYFVTFRLKNGLLSEDERKSVMEAIRHFHQIRYWVTTAVVMLDHVHLLLKPYSNESGENRSISKILQGIKGFSAREINKARGVKGALWQDESFDRIIRNYDEFLEKWKYIRNNPVKSELCLTAEEYPFLWEPGEEQE